jgi:hypothetical protein
MTRMRCRYHLSFRTDHRYLVIVDTTDLTSSTGTDNLSFDTRTSSEFSNKTDENSHVYFVDRRDYEFNSYYKLLTEKSSKNCLLSQLNGFLDSKLTSNDTGLSSHRCPNIKYRYSAGKMVILPSVNPATDVKLLTIG